MSFNFKQGNIQRYNAYTHSSTTALKLTSENSGSMIFCDCSANDITIDLPPVEEDSVGLNYEFLVVGAVATNTINIRSIDKSNVAENKIDIPGNFGLGNTATLLMVDGTKGDRLQIVSDGSAWYLNHLSIRHTLSIA